MLFMHQRSSLGAKDLTGQVGKNPGWDPLAVAVEAGHERGLAHAINVLPRWSEGGATTDTTPAHAWTEHSEWAVADMDGTPMTLNDGYVLPSRKQAVRERLRRWLRMWPGGTAWMGSTLDYIRYPGEWLGGRPRVPSHGRRLDDRPSRDWRRAQVTAAVAGVQDAVGVPVSAAVWCIRQSRG